MNVIELKLFFLCENEDLNRRLSACGCSPKIQCVFMDKPQEELAEDRWKHLIFTDSIEKLTSYLKPEYENIWMVYIGDSANLNEFDIAETGMRLEIWNSGESDAILKFRFQILLDKYKEWHDARWYRNLIDTAIDSIPDLVWYKDAKGAHMLVNNAFCETVNKTKEDVTGRGHYYIWDITPEEYASGEYVCMESEETVMNAGKTIMFEEPVKTSAGMKYFNTYKTPIYDMDGKIWGTVGVAHDVTDFSNMGVELSMLVENIPFPMIVCNNDWTAARINSYFRKLFGIGEEEIKDFNYQQFKEKMCVPCGEKEINEYNHSVMQDYYITNNGEKQIFSVVEQEIQDLFGKVTGHFCLFRDITSTRFYEKQLYNLAHTDSLTGLHNRRAFYEYIKEHPEDKLTLLYMDLDNFKQVNDQFGHDRGDEVLRKTAASLLELFADGVAARLGGDEFAVVLMGDADEQRISENIKALETAVRGMFRGGGFHINVSVGMVKCDGKTDIDAVIKEADEKMYKVKERHHEELSHIS